MVYGRYNYIHSYSIHGVYQPTYKWEAPSCMIGFWGLYHVVPLAGRLFQVWESAGMCVSLGCNKNGRMGFNGLMIFDDIEW